ncbi:MAG: RNA polymerase sigma factor [Gammaproteobacteria bacterium]|nr:RNA polymerase sigma factor [Gammaproteobacteria bacterium]
MLMKFPQNRAKQFEQLLRPLLPQLYRQAYRLCGHRSTAEDLVQELLTRLYAQGISLATLENVKAWLLKALYHQFIDFIRKQKSEKQVDGGEAAEHVLLNIACPQGSAEEITTRWLDQQRIEAALQSLNTDQRTVIVLHDMEGYTLYELEATLEIPVGTLKSRLHRGRRQLRAVLLREPFAAEIRVTR